MVFVNSSIGFQIENNPIPNFAEAFYRMTKVIPKEMKSRQIGALETVPHVMALEGDYMIQTEDSKVIFRYDPQELVRDFTSDMQLDEQLNVLAENFVILTRRLKCLAVGHNFTILIEDYEVEKLRAGLPPDSKIASCVFQNQFEQVVATTTLTSGHLNQRKSDGTVAPFNEKIGIIINTNFNLDVREVDETLKEELVKKFIGERKNYLIKFMELAKTYGNS